jgi:hypothetical protein
LTCPNGHKVNVDKGGGGERHLWCDEVCGWRMTVKIVKSHAARMREHRKKQKNKGYALK